MTDTATATAEKGRAGISYLATPYSKYAAGLDRAFADAARIAGRLLVTGVHVYSPIAHCHPLSIHACIDPLDLPFWLEAQERFMALCDALIVARLDGWDESAGIAHEVRFFTEAGKPIWDLNPHTLTMVKR